MEIESKRQKVVAFAKANPPSQHVPYAFEKRVMAHLRDIRLDPWAIWEKGLWKSAFSCASLVLLFAIFDASTPETTEDLSAVIENTVYAAVRDDIADSL